MRRLFGPDSLRSDNAEGARAAAALRRHGTLMRRRFGADSLRSEMPRARGPPPPCGGTER
jgi:hypothetical protein